MKTRVAIVSVLFVAVMLVSATAFYWVPALEELVGIGWGVVLTVPLGEPVELIIDRGGQ